MDGADVVRTASHRLGEGGGDRAGAQGVAERLTGPEVRGERQRGEELGQTERPGRPMLVRADHEWERYLGPDAYPVRRGETRAASA